jgi:hypothetical protein
MYDSNIMRFYAVDPLEEFASSYLFCGNNPIMFIDPTGKECEFLPEDIEQLREVEDMLNDTYKNLEFSFEGRKLNATQREGSTLNADEKLIFAAFITATQNDGVAETLHLKNTNHFTKAIKDEFMDNSDVGAIIGHEIMEAYKIGDLVKKISLQTQDLLVINF